MSILSSELRLSVVHFGARYGYLYDVWIQLGVYNCTWSYSHPLLDLGTCSPYSARYWPYIENLNLTFRHPYHFLLNRDCNLVYAALLPWVF